MAERCVRDAEVGSSNLPHPTTGAAGQRPAASSVSAAWADDRHGEPVAGPEHGRCLIGPVRLSLPSRVGKETPVDAAAKVSSKGQVTVPKAVRDALGLREGDEVVFRVEGSRAVLARTPDFLELAGTIRVPAAKRNVAWDEVIRRTRSARAASRR